MRSTLILITALFLSAVQSTPALAQTQNSHPARPGSINYVEGQASIDGHALNSSSAGSVELEKGQSLTTQAGKVEILLTPGVFLRVADNSTVKMVSPDLANTEVQLDKGRAMVEVLDIRKENDIRIDQNDASAKLLKKGLYDFDADHEQIRVLRGAVEVRVKDQNIKVNDRHALALSAGGKLKAQDYDTLRYEDDFFRWSAVRSGYLSEASVDQARAYIGPGPAGMAPAGTAWVGIGTRGSACGRFFPPTGFSIVPSGGASIRQSTSTGLRSFIMATGATNRIALTNTTRPMGTGSNPAVDSMGEASGAAVVPSVAGAAEVIAEARCLRQGPRIAPENTARGSCSRIFNTR